MKYFPSQNLDIIKYVILFALILFFGLSIGGYLMNRKEGMTPGNSYKIPVTLIKDSDFSVFGGGSNVPGPYGPGSHVPGSHVPGSHVPGSHVPGSNVPGSNVPGSNVPGSNVPGSNVPGADKKGLDKEDVRYGLDQLFNCKSVDDTQRQNIVNNLLGIFTEITNNNGSGSSMGSRDNPGAFTPGSNTNPNNLSNIQRFANGINNAIGTTGAILSTTVDAAGNIITKSLDAAGNIVTTTTDAAGNIISQTIGTAGNLLSGTANTLSNTARNVGSDVTGSLTSGASGISSLGKDAISGTTGLLKDVGSNLKNALTSGQQAGQGQQAIMGQQGGVGQQAIMGQQAGLVQGGMPVGVQPSCNMGCANMGVDYYSYYGALPTKTASNYMPATASFCSFGR